MTQSTISVSHVNIRESMSFLIFKLLVIECIIAFLMVTICLPLACVELSLPSVKNLLSPHIVIFVGLVLFKLMITVYIILQWLNEYYEITPLYITHRWGIMFRNESRYNLNTIGSLGVQQGIAGKFFNYGTIFFYDKTTRKYVYFFLIHNPLRYYHIIESLAPTANKEKNTLREKIIEEQDEEQ